MSNKLDRLCDRVIEAGWLLALIVAPLLFNPFSHNVFELGKIAAVRSIALVMLLAWMVKGVERGGMNPTAKTWKPSKDGWKLHAAFPKLWRSVTANPLPFLALLFLAAHGLATITSIAPRISLWGSYQRLEGLYTTGAYLVIFFSVLALLRTREQIDRLITTVLLVSLPVSLYGILQHFGADPLQWGSDVSARVTSTLGNPIFLAAFLIMAVPLTLCRLLDAWQKSPSALRPLPSALLLLIQLACILFTQSRGPWLGLMAGLLFFVLLVMIVQGRRKWTAVIAGAGVAMVLAVGLISIPNSPLQSPSGVPYFGRMSQVSEGSGRVRLLIWQGAAQLITAEPKRTLIGYGPETMFIAFPPYYDPELRRLEGQMTFPDRSHNETFDALVTTGVAGCAIYLLLFTGLIYYGMKFLDLIRSSKQRNLFFGLCFTGGMGAMLLCYAVDHSWRFLGIALPLGMLAGMFAYLVGYGLKGLIAENTQHEADVRLRLLGIGLISAMVAHFVEIQFGIAVAATRVSFWAYAGLLMAGWRMHEVRSSPFRGTAPEGATTNNHSRRPVAMKFVAIGLMIVMVSVVLTTNIDVVRADMCFKQAKIKFHEKGSYDQAIALYRRALELRPSQDLYYLFLGKAQAEKARDEANPQEREALFREAEMTLKKARALNPLDVDHTANLARLYYLWARDANVLLPSYRDKLFQNAFDLYAQAVAHCPGNILLWNDWGYAHFAMGNHEQALAKYRHALSLDSAFAPTYLRLGETYQAQSKWQQAAQAYQKAIAYNDTSIVAHSALGEMYARLGRFADAVRENQRVLELAPDNLITHTNLALLFNYLGKPRQALHHARQALKVTTPEQRAPLENFIAQLQAQEIIGKAK
jgi:tetratricopeptide (TPR) repeat protein/O-antigen ligase